MSKKNKKKLRKILRAQMAQKQMPGAMPASTQVAAGQVEVTNDTPAAAEAKIAPQQNTEDSNENKMVRREIRKILLTVSGLIIVIIAIYFINIKTDIILKLGQWLSKILNISV